MYGAALKIGLLIAPGLRETNAASFELLLRDPGALSWATVWSWLRGSSLPLLVGSTIVGVAAAAVTYVIAFAALARRRRTRGDGTAEAARRHVA